MALGRQDFPTGFISTDQMYAWLLKNDGGMFWELTGLDIGLQVLDSVIMTKWKILPREQCQGKD